MRLAWICVYTAWAIMGSSSSIVGAISRVIIPAASIVPKRLSQAGLPRFIEQAEVLRECTGKREHPLRVGLAVELACNAYCQMATIDMDAQKMREISKKMSRLQPRVFEALLQDNSAALDALRRRGMYRFSG